MRPYTGQGGLRRWHYGCIGLTIGLVLGVGIGLALAHTPEGPQTYTLDRTGARALAFRGALLDRVGQTLCPEPACALALYRTTGGTYVLQVAHGAELRAVLAGDVVALEAALAALGEDCRGAAGALVARLDPERID